MEEEGEDEKLWELKNDYYTQACQVIQIPKITRRRKGKKKARKAVLFAAKTHFASNEIVIQLFLSSVIGLCFRLFLFSQIFFPFGCFPPWF